MFKINRFDLLVSLYIGFIVISELMGAKTFPVSFGSLHLNITVAIFVLPLIYCINDIVVEVYGKERARSMVRSSLAVIFVIIIFSALATALPPSQRFASSEQAYDAVFSASIRMSVASLLAFAISEFNDVFIFAKIRQLFGKKKLWLRTNISNFASEFLDVIIFMSFAFYALDEPILANLQFILSIAIPYWLVRCSMSLLETPLVYIGVNKLRQPIKEQV